MILVDHGQELVRERSYLLVRGIAGRNVEVEEVIDPVTLHEPQPLGCLVQGITGPLPLLWGHEGYKD